MDSDYRGAVTVVAMLLAWIGYRAGARTQRVSSTWADHKDLRIKAGLVSRLRWVHAFAALIAWAVLIIAGLILLSM